MKKTSLDLYSADLLEHPQLAALAVLYSALEVAGPALIAAHPESWDLDMLLPDNDADSSEEAAYATALIFQIDALEATLNCYRHTIKWSRDRKCPPQLRPASQDPRQPSGAESQRHTPQQHDAAYRSP
jgi:hypothetical protein